MSHNEHIAAYIKEIDRLYQTGLTTEHSFRPALQKLLENLCDCTVVNEQSHIDCGAPDLTLLRQDLPFAFVEAKNLEDGDLDGRRKNKEQFDRYKASLNTILFTDYLDFRLYRNGEWVMSVRLAEIQGKHIRLSDEARLLEMMEMVRWQQPQVITSADKLARIMAAKARLLRDIIETAIVNDQQSGKSPAESELLGYMQSFQDVLLHDITPKTFADIYAQTIAYGMFAARLHDNTPDTFSRAEAAQLIPKTNPFLRKVFQEIAGYDLDERIAWIVDDLVAVFAATDLQRIMRGFGTDTQMTDPLMHFYEDFLFQYDPAAKKACGVYYTPQPVVNYIVRAVDDLLRTEFGLPMGLADTSKVTVEQERQQDSKHRIDRVQKHRVQVLDPAVGTGTFLAEVVRQIKRNLHGQMGGWKAYVSEHLLPRLHGFELMMAPYTIAHLKLDMEIGVSAQERLKVYLTNSLEEYNPNANTLFGNALSQEANAASHIKKEAPIMVMIGNPPYSGESKNKGKWIMDLMEDYKKEPGGHMPLQERNSKWINDDYCKFIRLGQYYVDRNNEGILAYICGNGFLDNPTFRGMRWHLLQSFDKIYILNLHGNSKKKETAPDGSKDENVFDIMTGVSINIFIKTGKKKKGELAEVYYSDLMGV
ncbi:MAG: N-6 DNA methylase, partial [Paludibacteraceae bacterium]